MKKLIFRNRSVSIHLMALGLFLLITAACLKKEEVPGNNEDPGLIEEYVVETEDKLTVTSDLPAYVFPHNYEGFGLALINRLNNKVPAINLENVESLATLVVHSSKLKSMGDDFGYLVGQLAMGNNVVIIEPTLESIRYFCSETTYLLQEVIKVDDEFGLNLEVDLYPGLRQTFEGFYEMSKDDSKIKSLFISNTDNQGVYAEAIAVRGCHFHIVDRMTSITKSETYVERLDTLTNTMVPVDEPQIDNPEGDILSETVTPYTYGLFADVFTNWINKQTYYREEVKELSTRGANAIETRSGTTHYNLEDICTAQKVDYTFNAPTPSNVSSPLPISVSIEICAVYMEEQKSDYYCIYKKVIAHNQYLNCGPQDEELWRRSDRFGHMGTAWWESRDVFYKDNYYGPFLRNIRSAASVHQTSYSEFTDSEGLVNIRDIGKDLEFVTNATIEKYSPINSVGSSSETHGFSYGFSGGFCYSEKPSFNVGLNMSWSSSTTRTVSDLKCEYYTYDENRVNWKYEGQNLPYEIFELFGSPSHTFAPEILRTECVLDQSWIWKITNPVGTYQFADVIDVDTCVMWYEDRGMLPGYNTMYTNQNTWTWLSFRMAPPPRYVQKWAMHVECSEDGQEGSKIDQTTLDAEIKTMHPDFWIESGADVKLPDASKESRVSITEFIDKFKNELNNKLPSWRRKNLYGTFTFTFINHDFNDEYKYEFKVEESSDNN